MLENPGESLYTKIPNIFNFRYQIQILLKDYYTFFQHALKSLEITGIVLS